MSGGVRLELLGAARAFRDGAPVSGLGRKALALLAYLAASPGKLHSRDHLADLLWSDRFDEQARQSLRQTLTSIRKALGDVVATEEGGVSLPADCATSDAGEFETLAKSRDPDALRRVSELYRGDFVEAFTAVSPVFDEWAEAERRRLRDLLSDALETLALGELGAGRFEEALAPAQRLLALDPANEQACRAAMQALFSLGRRSAALRQFEACRIALARTLDAKPAPETQALAERIQQASAPDNEEIGAPASSRQDAGAPMRAPDPRERGSTFKIQNRAGPILRRAVRLSRNAQFALLFAGFALVAAIGAFALSGRGSFLNSPPAPSIKAPSRGSACAAAIGLPDPVAPSIAVLPLQHSGGAGAADFAGATTTRIGDLLGDIPALTVKRGPREESQRASPAQIARQLGVSHLVEGVVRMDGENAQVSVRLVDRTGAVLQTHAQTYNLARPHRRRAQNAISIAVAEAVQVHLTEGEQALPYYAHPTRSIEVFEHLTRAARHFDQMSRTHNARARREYAAAHAIDPRDPRALNGLGWTHLIDAYGGWSANPAADVRRAKTYARQAIAADHSGGHFYPHSLLSVAALMEDDHERARAHGEEAVRVSDGAADAAALLSLALSYSDDRARSAEMAKMALRRRPLTYPLWYEWVLGRAARLNGETNLALACLPLDRVRDARFALPMMERAALLAQIGQVARVRREMSSFAARSAGTLTAEAYCARPSYANAALTQRCIVDLRRAGLR